MQEVAVGRRDEPGEAGLDGLAAGDGHAVDLVVHDPADGPASQGAHEGVVEGAGHDQQVERGEQGVALGAEVGRDVLGAADGPDGQPGAEPVHVGVPLRAQVVRDDQHGQPQLVLGRAEATRDQHAVLAEGARHRVVASREALAGPHDPQDHVGLARTRLVPYDPDPRPQEVLRVLVGF